MLCNVQQGATTLVGKQSLSLVSCESVQKKKEEKKTKNRSVHHQPTGDVTAARSIF